ncbi:MAG: hypothetical protein ACRDTC_24960 [Pseudonocardiaceae bacterium]
MHAIRMPMSAPAQSSRHAQGGASLRSKPTGVGRRLDRLAIRDHRDDGSLIGGLIVMLLIALPFWVMAIILLTSLL